MTRRILFVLIVAAILWLAAPFQAAGNAPFVLQTDMFGGNQVPPVDTGAWGFVRFFFSDDRLEADYTVDVKGLSGTLVYGADIHRGGPGTNGPVVKHLADGGFIVTSGHLSLTPEELDEVVSGGWYVSLKTRDHPGGELRGQITVPGGFVPGPPPPLPPQAPARQPPPATDIAAPPPGPFIQPPDTGDAGLLDAGTRSPSRPSRG